MTIKHNILRKLLSFYQNLFSTPSVRLLLIVIIVAFFVRVWGVWNIEQTDEFNEVFEALKVCSGRLNLERWNKKVLIYILAIEYGLYYIFGWFFDSFSNPADFASKIAVDMFPLFLIGRITSAFLGTLIILITYKAGKILFDKRTGLLAALFLSVNFVHVEHSHLVLVDITMSLAIICAFYWALKIAEEGKIGSYLLAGLFAGLSVVAKIPAVFILISLAIAHLVAAHKQRLTILEAIFSQKILLLVVGGLSGAVAGSPGILVAPLSYFKYLLSLIGQYEGTSEQIYFFTSTNGYLFYLKSIINNMGITVSFFIIIGIILLVHSRKLVLLISFVVPYYLFMSKSNWFLADRYMIPIFPFLSIISAFGIIELLKRIRLEKYYIHFGIFLIILPIINLIPFEMALFKENTRYFAKEWIEKNIPSGSKILLDAGKTINTYSPPLFQNEDNLRKMIVMIEDLEANKTYDESRIVDRQSSVYFKILLDDILTRITYDLTSTERGEGVRNYEFYKEMKYDYIITSNLVTWRTKVSRWREQFPEQARFYDVLEQKEPLKLFSPDRFRSGPLIKIYSVR